MPLKVADFERSVFEGKANMIRADTSACDPATDIGLKVLRFMGFPKFKVPRLSVQAEFRSQAGCATDRYEFIIGSRRTSH
jgi:hypothetical protein